MKLRLNSASNSPGSANVRSGKAARLVCAFLATFVPLGLNAAELFNNFNGAPVVSNPTISTCQTILHLDNTAHITSLVTYNWNNGQGPGRQTHITLQDMNQASRTYGPFTTSGPGVNQVAAADIDLGQGDYQIVTDGYQTWSWNNESLGCGFAKVEGDYNGLPNPQPTAQIFSNYNAGGLSALPAQRANVTIAQPTQVTLLETDMFNQGLGTAFPGTITLDSGNCNALNGQVHLTFQAYGYPGVSPLGVVRQNLSWLASPANLSLASGMYCVSVSDPQAWANNAQSSGQGFVRIFGR